MIFKDVKYFLSTSLNPQRRDELSKVLDANGGKSTELSEATHVVTNSHVFEGYQSLSGNVVVVKDQWVDRSIVLGKQQNVKIYSADPVMIFSGVTVCTSEIATSDQEVIAAGIKGLGGAFREGFTRDCTHLIVPRPGSEKYEAAIHHKSMMGMHVVVPHWFDDCFQQMMHLPEHPYEWPDPEILKYTNSVTGDPSKKKCVIPKPRRDLIRTALATLPDDNGQIQAEKSLAEAVPGVWEGKKILLSHNLGVEQVLESVKVSIRRADGILLDLDYSQSEEDLELEELRKVYDADIYVTQFRAGRAYLTALKENKTIGSLAWLFHVQRTGTIVRPEDHLLHYPRRSHEILNFEKHHMTISNYSDDARAYLKRLITLMGGHFTPEMNQTNTIVIAAFIQGKKTEKAREWGIPIVNHTWLEDCFVAWRDLTPAQEKYISFPQGLSFAELVAQRGVGRIGFDVASPQEVAAIEAEIAEVERVRRQKGRERERHVEIDETRDDVQMVPATRSQKEAMEVAEVLMDLDDDDPKAVDGNLPENQHKADITEEDEPPVHSPPSAPAKKRGRPRKETKKAANKDDDDGESQPRRVSLMRGASGSKKASSARGGMSKKAHTLQSETELESDEEPVTPIESPKGKKRRGRPPTSKAATPSRALPESEEEEEEEEDAMQADENVKKGKAYSGTATSSPVKSKAQAKKLTPATKTSQKENVTEVGPDDEPAPSRTPARRLTRSATSSPVKVPTASFYGASPKKQSVASSSKNTQQRKKEQKQTGSSSRLDELMQDLSSSDDELGGFSSPEKPKGKEKEKARTAPKRRPAHIPTDNEGDDDVEEVQNPVPNIRVGPPKGMGKKGSIATSTPKNASSSRRTRRSRATDDEADGDDDDVRHGGEPRYAGPSPNHIVEVVIPQMSRSQLQNVAGPSRAAASEKLTVEPTARGKPGRKRARSPSPAPASASAKSANKRATAPTSFEPDARNDPEVQPNTSRRKSDVASIPTYDLSSTSFSGRPAGRKAAAAAAQKLKDDVNDANRYEKEKKSGRIRGAWELNDGKEIKNAKSKSDSATPNLKRRANGAPSLQKEDVDELEEIDDDKRGKKKRKIDETPLKKTLEVRQEAKGKKAHFITNENNQSQESRVSDNGPPGRGIKFMTTATNLEEHVVQGLLKLGMKKTEKPSECTHLIVKKISRTEKFLCALANAPYVVTPEWADASVKAGNVADPSEHALYDPDGEAKFKMSLEKTLERARFQKGKLFLGHTFYVTPGVDNYETVKKVIAAHSGKIDKSKPTVDRIKQDKDFRHLISTLKDKKIWVDLAVEGYPIFSSDAIFNAVCRHDLDWTDRTVQLSL